MSDDRRKQIQADRTDHADHRLRGTADKMTAASIAPLRAFGAFWVAIPDAISDSWQTTRHYATQPGLTAPQNTRPTESPT